MGGSPPGLGDPPKDLLSQPDPGVLMGQGPGAHGAGTGPRIQGPLALAAEHGL